jgi:hypothetical protein
LARLAKLPACTAQVRPVIAGFADGAELGAGAAVSSGAVLGGAAAGGVSAGGAASALVPVLASAPPALGASVVRASGGWALDAAASEAAGSGSGALLVARSTVTLRTGSGALTGSLGTKGAGAGAGGPDSSSGTISTMSTTRIEAPTKRSLTRRSIELVSLERE